MCNKGVFWAHDYSAQFRKGLWGNGRQKLETQVLIWAMLLTTWWTYASQMTFFFFLTPLFAAIRSQGAVLLVSFQAVELLLYWPVYRCAKSKRQSPNIKSTDESGWMEGEATGVCGVWWELCEEVTEGWGIAIFFSLTPFCRDKVSRSCFTGQLPGIRTVFILASPLTNQGGWGGRRLGSAGSGGSCARRSLRDCDGGLDLRKGGWLLHLAMREAVAAWRKGAGVSRVLARARLVMKEAASSLQRPPTSIPRTTKRHREFRRSSG